MDKLARWHTTKPGLLVFAAIELAAFYGFASLAIDRGSLLWYFLGLLALIGGLHNVVRLGKELWPWPR